MCKTTSSEQAPRPITFFAPQLDLPMGPLMNSSEPLPTIDLSDLNMMQGVSMQSNSPSSNSSSSEDERKAKPACVNCRRSKVKCEGGIPCKRCTRLSLNDSCRRCEPKKRGRKRKANTKAPEKRGREVEEEEKLSIAPSAPPAAEKRFKESDAISAAAAVMPNKDQNDVEKYAIERFASLTGQFRTWRDKMRTVPRSDKVAHTRFAWFCSYISHIINDYMNECQSKPNSQKLVSVWLCSNLAEDVNQHVSTTDPELLKFPESATDMNHFKLNIQKEAYRMFPTGVCILPMQPRPFDPNQKAWVSDKLAHLLGYSAEDLSVIMSNRNLFERLMYHSSFSTYSGAFWDAVEKGSYCFTTKLFFEHSTGSTMEFTCTFQLEYNNGIPMYATVFMQTNEEVYSDLGLESVAFVEETDKLAMLEPCPVGTFDFGSDFSSSTASLNDSPMSPTVEDWNDKSYTWNAMPESNSDSLFDLLQSGPSMSGVSFL